jgi:hypothetical protein
MLQGNMLLSNELSAMCGAAYIVRAVILYHGNYLCC